MGKCVNECDGFYRASSATNRTGALRTLVSFLPKNRKYLPPGHSQLFHPRKHLSTQAACISYSLADEGPIWFGHGGSVRWATPPPNAARRSWAGSRPLAARYAAFCPEQ